MSTREEEDDSGHESSSSAFVPPWGEDISETVTWTVSSAKLGYGVENLLDFSSDTYWQSDGFPPHIVTLHFRAFTIVTSVMILTSESDDSYFPKFIELRAGTEEEGEFMPLTLLDNLELHNGWNEVTTFMGSGWGEPETQRWSSQKKKGSGMEDRITKEQGVFTGGQRSQTNNERMRRLSDNEDVISDEEDEVDLRDKFFGCTKMQLIIVENLIRGRDCRIRGIRIFTVPAFLE